jgi:hypothetical protein
MMQSRLSIVLRAHQFDENCTSLDGPYCNRRVEYSKGSASN